MIEDYFRESLKDVCFRLWIGNIIIVGNLCVFSLLWVYYIIYMGKFIRLLFNIGGNIYGKM